MSQWRDSDAISVAPQRRFVVRMECADGRIVKVGVTAGSMDSVLDQVRGRRIGTPGDMVGYTVSEIVSA